MSIKSLPSSTIRIIGSSQVLTDPTSVVKELVDNALDARATSIFVELSANALDVIQVRDNGNGVAPEDRDMVCRRYCTSKIRDYSDLKDVGGKWLGFRGEALSSAAELSGTMTLTTRIEGEDVAVALKIKTNGEVEERDRASHPVGTTVRLTDLFSGIPVRKQSALKQSAKTLAKTKRMLQSYAFARPYVRFSLRILKTKNEKGNWTYAPKPDASVEDAAFKVIGQECASQCEWMITEKNGFEVQAFLPKPDAEGSKISNIGHFVSIDSRPVATRGGTVKQLMTAFKEKLRLSQPRLANAKEIFIWLNIVCPPQSYDPNIEPAKDDVMFQDKDKVIEAVNDLFDRCYPKSATTDISNPICVEDAPWPVAQPRPAVQESENAITGVIDIFEDPIGDGVKKPAKRQRISRSNMYGGHDEDNEILDQLDLAAGIDVDDEDAQSPAGVRDVTISNPWIFAKMNTSVRPSRTGSARNGQLLTPLKERNNSDANSTSRTEPAFYPPHPPWHPPSPRTSSPLRGKYLGNYSRHAFANNTSRTHATSSTEDMGSSHETDPTHDALEETHVPETRQEISRPRYTGWKAINDFVPARELPLQPAVSVSPDASCQQFHPLKRQQYARAATAAATRIQKPFVSPVHDEANVWFDNLPSSSFNPKKRNAGNKRRQAQPQDLDIREVFASREASMGDESEGHGINRRQGRLGSFEDPADLEQDDMEFGMDAARLRRRQHLDSSDSSAHVHAEIHRSQSDIFEIPPPFTPSTNSTHQHPHRPSSDNNNNDNNDNPPQPPPAQPVAHKPTRRPSHLCQPLALHNLNLHLQTPPSLPTLSTLASTLHAVERECSDLLAPVWGFPAPCFSDGYSDGEGDFVRSSLRFPPPTKREVEGWEGRLRGLLGL